MGFALLACLTLLWSWPSQASGQPAARSWGSNEGQACIQPQKIQQVSRERYGEQK